MMIIILILNGGCILWIDNTVSDIFWIWDVLIFIRFTVHWINIFVVKHIILKFHGQLRPSPFENCYSIAVTVLDPSSELEIDKSISEGNECLISKMFLFHNWMFLITWKNPYLSWTMFWYHLLSVSSSHGGRSFPF